MAQRDRIGKQVYGRLTAGCILLSTGMALLILAKGVPGLAVWYTVHIYPLWVGTAGRFFGMFPFSVSELCLYTAVILFGVSILLLSVRVLKRKPVKRTCARLLSAVFLAASVLWFLYVVNCGINYERVSFAEDIGIHTRQYTADELTEVCIQLTGKVNKLSGQVERDAQNLALDGENVGADAVDAMTALGDVYSQMQGYYPRPKGLLNPWILSVQNLTGIYSPFTIEANYNSGMTAYNIPFTACHELSHLRGYMQEEEANFIAFLACMESEVDEFRYSGSLMGWIYCMDVLHKVDGEAWQQVRGQLAAEVEADLEANSHFWAQYDGRAAKVANKVNDTYLKANGQADGVHSYNRMVDLLVEYFR